MSGQSFDHPADLLKVAPDGHNLVHADGAPFFWMGDTAWGLPMRTKREDVIEYLDIRKDQGFNVLLMVVAHFENRWFRYDFTRNAYGLRAFSNERDPGTIIQVDGPNNDWWDHVEYIIDEAKKRNMYVAVTTSWGRHSVSSGVLNSANAEAYGRRLGAMFRDKTNIVWVHGGDTGASGGANATFAAVARGIKASGAPQLQTFHPYVTTNDRLGSADFYGNAEWIDFHTYQSSHLAKDLPNYMQAERNYRRSPAKPVQDMEPRYEDHPVNWEPSRGYFNDFDVRQAAYWPVFAGAFGHTYGSVDVWQWNTSPDSGAKFNIREALRRPGAYDMKHLTDLMYRFPLQSRKPDQSLIASGQRSGGGHLQAMRGDDYAFVYTPYGSPFSVALGTIAASQVAALWYSPRDGSMQDIGRFSNSGTRAFDPPGEERRGNDWVLVLFDGSKGYSLW